MPVPAADVAVVVVNFGSHELIEANFARCPDPVCRAGQVYVVDNFSSLAEREAITAVCERHHFTLLSQTSNGGFAAGCNAGVDAAISAGAEVILLVNPDAVLSREVATALAAEVVAEPDVVVSPRLVTSASRPYFHGIRLDLSTGRMRSRSRSEPDRPSSLELTSAWPDRDWLTAACLAVNSRLWRSARGMDESYFLYWEDVDFSQRCVEVGGRLRLRNDLVAVHDEGGTHGKLQARARSNLYYYYNCRNRLLYASRHLPRRLLWRWLLRTPAESWQILLRGGRRQLLSRPSCAWAATTGSLAGVGIAGRRLFAVQR